MRCFHLETLPEACCSSDQYLNVTKIAQIGIDWRALLSSKSNLDRRQTQTQLIALGTGGGCSMFLDSKVPRGRSNSQMSGFTIWRKVSQISVAVLVGFLKLMSVSLY